MRLILPVIRLKVAALEVIRFQEGPHLIHGESASGHIALRFDHLKPEFRLDIDFVFRHERGSAQITRCATRVGCG
jgi:hypothetical protein